MGSKQWEVGARSSCTTRSRLQIPFGNNPYRRDGWAIRINLLPKTSSVREITGSKDQALLTPTVMTGKIMQWEGECGHHRRIRLCGWRKPRGRIPNMNITLSWAKEVEKCTDSPEGQNQMNRSQNDIAFLVSPLNWAHLKCSSLGPNLRKDFYIPEQRGH